MARVPASEERKMYLSLRRLCGKLIQEIKDGKLDSDGVRSQARNFIESDEVDKYLRGLVARMVNRTRIDTAKALKQQAAGHNNGPLIYELLKHEMDGPVGRRVWELIAENVQYIKTVPQIWAEFLSRYMARETLKGRRPEHIEAELREKMPEHIANNLKTIARTECAKANAAICQARAEAIGIKCYIWRCVHDNRVRDSHWDMDGILIFYDDPPSPEELFPYKGSRPYGHYHAGNTFNCRCYQEAVIDVRFLPDVFKYYRDGQIVQTTRGAFIKKFGDVAA